MNKEKTLLILFIVLYIFIRSINFSDHLNFSFDQAWTSTRAHEIWKNKEFTLVGPGSSIVTGGKQILQGSINYYFLLIFLLLGNFDPVISSYIFMLFSAFMLIPLYYGVKLLINEKIAILLTVIYTFMPLYIDFSRFFFGPNFQFSLMPLLILFAGKYKQTGKYIYLFLVFFVIGVICQFHFATLLFYAIFLIYYLFLFKKKSKNKLSLILISLVAFLIGFSPILLFEIKNRFYNTIVFMEYLRNSRSLSNFELLPHRYLNLSLLVLIFIFGYYKKLITYKLIVVSCVLFLALDLIIYSPIPKQAFGMSKNWNYPLEKTAYEIIKKEKVHNFNIVNLIYDNKAVVIKYLMKKDGMSINFDDYYRNNYLFVIAETEKQISESPAYEITTFSPRKKIKEWKLNNSYNLYLFKRIK